MPAAKPSQPIQLYLFTPSPPSRAVWFTLKILKLPFELKVVAFGDQLKEPYKKVNEYGLVPTIVDGDFTLSESRAILQYLVERYGGPDTRDLYPADTKRRALVNMRMEWDGGQLFRDARTLIRPVIFAGKTELNADAEKEVLADLKMLDNILTQSPFVAGDRLTIADVSTATSVIFLEFVNVDLSGVPKVAEWLRKMKKNVLPDYAEVSGKGHDEFAASISSKCGRGSK